MTDTLIGTRVAGRFRIVQHLGEGSVGDVYLAEHEVLQRSYAIKLLKRKFLTNRTVIERFRREALVASRLSHPHIVEISDFGQAEEGRLYLAMELIRGPSLGAAIEAHLPGILPLGRTLKILQQIASAIAAAHDAGVLHRDLKPDNVMLATSRSGDEVVKILDFGLAKIMVDPEALVLTRRGEMFGTPMYMSPEQARGEPLDSRTDIYALGATAFKLCTGRPPFTAKRIDQLLMATQTLRPPAPSSVQPAGSEPIPADLDALILHCLEKDRDRRPLRMSEVRAVIERCRAKLKVTTSPYVTTQEYGKVTLEELQAEMAGAATVLAGAGGSSGGGAGAVRASRHPSECQAESLTDASIVEFDPYHWQQVCHVLVSLAQLLKSHDVCPPEVVAVLRSLIDQTDRIAALETDLSHPKGRLDDLESAHREQAAQLRHAVIDLSLERGRVAEDPAVDPQRMVDLDFQIKTLEERLAQVYRAHRAERQGLERQVTELETRIEEIRSSGTELELRLLDDLRTLRPRQAPPEVDVAYEQLDQLLATLG